MLGVSVQETTLGWRVIRVHYLADPDKNPDTEAGKRWLEQAKAGMSDARWQKEMEIDYGALQGERYFPEYSNEYNVCDPHDVSDANEWTIYHGCDPHQRVAHAHVWVAFSSHGDVRVCGELWPNDVKAEKRQITTYAEAIKELESDSTEKDLYGNGCFEWANGKKLVVHKRIMDTYGHAADAREGQDYFAAYAQHGIRFYEAKKSDLAAVRESVAEALASKPTIIAERNVTDAQMKVFRPCIETQKEFETIRYPEGDVERRSQERPVTYHKHCLDCILYIFADGSRFILRRHGPRETGWKPIYEALNY